MDPQTLSTRVAQGRLEVLQICCLLKHVRDRDKAHIQKMVSLGVPDLINLTEPTEGKSALHVACIANDTDMVRFLLTQGAHLNVQDLRGRTPVMLAAELGHDTTVELLAEEHANIDIVDNEGKGVLFFCISPTKRHMRCLQVLLTSGADVNNTSEAGKPAFLQACQNAQECGSMCLSILERGADPNAVDEPSGRSALMEACRAGDVELARAILLKGGDPNTLDKKKMNAVHMAAGGGFFEVIVLLSAYGADFAAVDVRLSNALHVAAAGGFTDCCRFLAQRGCNAKQKNSEGLLPRQMATDKATIKELKRAERLQGDSGSSDANKPWKLTLHDWSWEHQDSLCSTMKTLGLNEEVDGTTNAVATDTFVKAMMQHNIPLDNDQLQEIVQAHDQKREGLINIDDFFKGLCFLEKAFTLPSYAPKVKRAGKGKQGKKKGKFVLPMPICVLPPKLHYRRQDGGPPRFMVEKYQHFTDTKRFDSEHPPRHPFEDDSAWYIDEQQKAFVNINYCVRTSDLASLSLAFSQAVPLDVQDRYYKTPLIAACNSANLDVAKFLISLGADVNICDQFSWTPLHHACHAGQTDIVQLLVGSGVKVNTPAMNGATPLMRAIESRRLSCVDYLIKAGADVQAENAQGQNCLAIAQYYGDLAITELIQGRVDRLLKSKEQKGKSDVKAEEARSSRAIPAFPPLPQSEVFPVEPYKQRSMREGIITVNKHTNSRGENPQDISYMPRTMWGKQLTEKKKEKKDLLPFNF